MNSMRHAFLALALAFAACLSATPAFAQPVITVSSIDQSDLWYIPAESGWGVQLVERNSTIFATLFVYDPSNNPTWYVATMSNLGSNTWGGDLYATTGPWFGTVPFNPANVTATKVGTMNWTAGAFDNGTVAYTVNGVAVTKNVVRETLVLEDYSGHFGGVFHQTGSGCENPAFDATTDTLVVLDIAKSGSNLTVTTTSAVGLTCAFSGTQLQDGQMGVVGGTYTCSNGFAGSFGMGEMQRTEVSVKGLFSAQASNPAGCEFSGWFGGVTVTTF